MQFGTLLAFSKNVQKASLSVLMRWCIIDFDENKAKKKNNNNHIDGT